MAQTTWNGGTGNWTSAANWTPAVTPSAGTPQTVIDTGTVQINSGVSAGSGTSGLGTNEISLLVGGGSSLARLELLGGGDLSFHRMEIGANGTYFVTSDNWGGGCLTPCIRLSGGTLQTSGLGRLYFNSFTMSENTTSTIEALPGSTLSLQPTSGISANDPYIFEQGSTLQFVGQIAYLGGTTVQSFGDTGIVVLSGGVLTGLGPGLHELTATVDKTSVNAGGTLNFNDINATVNSLQGAGVVDTGINAGTLISFRGGFFSGGITGAGGIEVIDNGTLTLSGTNTYAGNTAVDLGSTLVVDGSVASPLTTVDGILRGGTAAPGTLQDVALSGTAIIAPGTNANEIGSLNTQAITFAANTTYAVDINMATGASDRIDAASATIDGTAQVNVLDPLGPSRQFTLLHSTAVLVDNGVNLAGVNNTQFVTYSLTTDPNNLFLNVAVDLNPASAGLNENQSALAEHFNSVLDTDPTGLAPVLTALMGLPDGASYRAALDQLSPEIYLKSQIDTLFSALDFADSLMSCRVRDGSFAIIRQGECLWFDVDARFLNQDQTRQSVSLDSDAVRFSGGAQVALSPGLHASFAGGIEHTSIETTSAKSEGERAHGGVGIKYTSGPLFLAVAGSGGYAWYDTDRSMAFGGFAGTASSDNEVGYLNGRVRAGWLFDAQNWYLKPLVDVDVTHVHLDGVRESGAGGGANLKVRSDDETIVSASPVIEVGSDWHLSNGSVIQPFVSAGVSIFDDPEFALNASFDGTPPGVSTFLTKTESDDVLGKVSAGVNVVAAETMNLKLSYDGLFGDTTRQQSVGAKGTVAF